MSICCSARKVNNKCYVWNWFRKKVKDDDTCDICMYEASNSVILPCGHATYCLNCMKKHIGRCNTCPTCRQDIKSIHRIYK